MAYMNQAEKIEQLRKARAIQQNVAQSETEVDKDILALKEANSNVTDFSADVPNDPMEVDAFNKYVSDRDFLTEKIAEKVVNNLEYANEFNSKADRDIKELVYSQDLETLKHSRFHDPMSWLDKDREKVNSDLKALDKGKATYQELNIDEKMKDPVYAKIMNEYISSYNEKVPSDKKFDLNSYKLNVESSKTTERPAYTI